MEAAFPPPIRPCFLLVHCYLYMCNSRLYGPPLVAKRRFKLYIWTFKFLRSFEFLLSDTFHIHEFARTSSTYYNPHPSSLPRLVILWLSIVELHGPFDIPPFTLNLDHRLLDFTIMKGFQAIEFYHFQTGIPDLSKSFPSVKTNSLVSIPYRTEYKNQFRSHILLFRSHTLLFITKSCFFRTECLFILNKNYQNHWQSSVFWLAF